MSTQVPEEPARSRGPGDAAAKLGQDTAELVRQQLRDARAELTATIRRGGLGTVLLAGAGVCGTLAVWSAHETALRALETVLPKPWAAGSLTVGYAVGAGVLAAYGRDRIKAAAGASGQALDQARRHLPTSTE